MREKVEAQGGVSDPAAGTLGTRGVRVLGWAAGERESSAEILSGAPQPGRAVEGSMTSKTKRLYEEQSCVRR